MPSPLRRDDMDSPLDVDLENCVLTDLDARDQDAIRRAVYMRLHPQRVAPGGIFVMPPGTPDTAAGAIAEICRGWMELLAGRTKGRGHG